MHLTGTPARLVRVGGRFACPCRGRDHAGFLARAREDRFDSIAAFVGALRGDAGGAATALGRSSSSGDLPTFGEGPVSGAERAAAVQSITTLFAGDRWSRVGGR